MKKILLIILPIFMFCVGRYEPEFLKIVEQELEKTLSKAPDTGSLVNKIKADNIPYIAIRKLLTDNPDRLSIKSDKVKARSVLLAVGKGTSYKSLEAASIIISFLLHPQDWSHVIWSFFPFDRHFEKHMRPYANCSVFNLNSRERNQEGKHFHICSLIVDYESTMLVPKEEGKQNGQKCTLLTADECLKLRFIGIDFLNLWQYSSDGLDNYEKYWREDCINNFERAFENLFLIEGFTIGDILPILNCTDSKECRDILESNPSACSDAIKSILLKKDPMTECAENQRHDIENLLREMQKNGFVPRFREL